MLSRRVYEPAQYSANAPANLLVCFDGGGAVIQHPEAGPTGGEPVLLDNLHATNAIPVTIVVGITPGRNPDYPEQRSLEYDTVRTAVPRSTILHDCRLNHFVCRLVTSTRSFWQPRSCHWSKRSGTFLRTRAPYTRLFGFVCNVVVGQS